MREYRRRKHGFEQYRRKHVKTDRDTESNKTFALLDEVDGDEEDDIDNLLNNSNTECVLEKIFENDIVPDEQLNNVLTSKANNHVAEDTEPEAIDEENVKPE